MNFKMDFNIDAVKEAIERKTDELLQNREYEVECPHCKKSISISPGKHPCPKCGEIINLSLDIHR